MSRNELRPATSVYQGRLYHFDSEISKWCFDIEPERYAGHMTVVDSFLSGEIQPMDLTGALAWMGLTPDVMGDDAYEYRWAAEYAEDGGHAGEQG
jgi:toluene monooxygenase system protein A